MNLQADNTEIDDELDTDLDESQQEGDEESEGLDVSFGEDESPPSEDDDSQEAPEWVKNLRKEHKELKRKLRDAESKLGAQSPPAKERPKLGPKPKIDDPDVNYDQDALDRKLDAWIEQRDAVKKAEEEEKAAENAQKSERQKLENDYKAEAESLKVKDFKDAEDDVVEALSPQQQGILLSAAEKPAVLVYALGKKPEKLKALSEIKNPAKFAAAIGKLELEIKVKPRSQRPAPEPEAPRGTGSRTTRDQTLERLRAEAEKTGDNSKVLAYRRKMAAARK